MFSYVLNTFEEINYGNITIHKECKFASPTPRGSWQIVGGSGAFANLKGNGSLTTPPNTEAMTGNIYSQ